MAMAKTNLIGMTSDQLEQLLVSLGEKTYRGRQIFKWLYKLNRYNLDDLTDLSKDLRDRLGQGFDCHIPDPAAERISTDGTRKYLFRLADDEPIETVLIPDDDSGRRTVCVSSQAGCALGCTFCATGDLGFRRNLTVGEIVSQLLYLRGRFGETAFSNIVFMGMGEPMMNLDNVLDAIGIITDGAGLCLGDKKITISTSGIVPGILRLAELRSKVRLAVSLNAAIQAKREKIMPVARKYPLHALMDALRTYTHRTGFRVTFEYALFAGFNDTPADRQAIIKSVRGIPCKINILAYNPVSNSQFQRPTAESVDDFVKKLCPHVPAVTVRKSRGSDIEAACGQLAGGQSGRKSK
jgi:23S rRNA (adenine2503-C2)-methyltransferase